MRDVVVDLADAAAMFGPPQGDPLLPGFALSNGIDRAIAAVEALPGARRREARLVLRMPAPAPGEAERMAGAVARHAAARQAEAGARLAALRREGMQTLMLAAGFIFALLLLWALVEMVPGEGMLKGLAGDGVVVAGWVALWRPLDLLLYDTWLLRRDMRILGAVAAMPVVVAAAD